MEHTFKKPRFTRLASLLLALAMVLSMFPVTAFAFEPSVKLTNAAGEETTTFAVGDPIFVEYKGMTVDSDWIALWGVPYPSTYHLYQYASEDKVNLFDGVWTDSGSLWNGMWLDAGTYEIWYKGDKCLATITLVDPESTDTKSLEVLKTSVEAGEPIQIKAVNYSEYSWVGIYSGTHEDKPSASSLEYFYCLGHENVVMEYIMEPGAYTIVMYNDYDGNSIEKILHVTVKGEATLPELTVSPMSVAYSDNIEINVSANVGGGSYWVGLYKEGENPNGEGVVSIFWYSHAANETFNIVGKNSQRAEEFLGGSYDIYLLAGGSQPYEIVDSVTGVEVVAEIDESKTVTVDPTCMTNGKITYTYTDGTTKEVDHTENPDLAAKGHDLKVGDPTYTSDAFGNKADSKFTHAKACSRNCGEEGATVTEACVWNEGVAGEGYVLYTCTLCSGTVKHVEKEVDGEPVVVAPTCMEKGYTQINYVDGTYIRVAEVNALGHKYGNWTHDDENGGHSRTCTRDNCDKDETATETGTCADSTPVLPGAGNIHNTMKFTCEECGYEWNEETIIIRSDSLNFKTNKDGLLERLVFVVNKAAKYNLDDAGKKEWIGLFTKEDADNGAYAETALYWLYMNIFPNYEFDFDIIDPNADGSYKTKTGIPAGEYALVLLDNNDYDHLATLYFSVHDCKDTDNDHNCNTCGDPMSECTDEDPKDHICDVCDTKLGDCKDDDVNHACDVCAKPMGEHKGAEGTHICNYCKQAASSCADGNKDHKCDVCGETLTTCVDKDKNHKCDTCETEMGKHEDTNKDHSCDYGCDVIIGKCVDNNTDHKCDYGCSETFGVCEDEDGDGKCDYGCDKKYETDPTEPDATEPDATEPDATEPDATEPEAPKVEGVDRVAGDDRFKTAVEVADQMKEVLGIEKFQTIIVASGATYADALPGSYLAIVKNAPILLGHTKDKYNTLAQEYIKANLAEGGTVYILGGTSAVPASFEAGLGNVKVERLAGANRFETNMLILEAAGVKEGDEIMVCTGADYADALSASAAGKPILLVHKKLYDYQVKFLEGLKNNTFCVIGGEKAVLPAIEEAVSAYGKTERLAGKDRMLTSHMVAERYFEGSESAVVAYGWNFPDGLCGGPLANALKSPLILTHSKEKLYNVTAEFAKDAGIKTGLILGGDALIPDAAINAIYGTTPVALG